MARHLKENRQMLFLSGPRQVGKTTTARQVGKAYGESFYRNWDNQRDRHTILAGPEALADEMHLDRLRARPPLVILDEIRKYAHWKIFLKGLFDSYGDRLRIVVTGSARLDIYRAGGDSLMGRYFPYRMHPLSVAELVAPRLRSGVIRRRPAHMTDDAFAALIEFGGFPEPYLKRNRRFSNRWRRLRSKQLFREDLRDLTRIQELGQLEFLAEMLRQRVGHHVSYSSLANQVGVSVDTIRRWLGALSSLYYCFPLRPWFKNVNRALRKEPRFFLWDWTLAADPGARAENFAACALLKAAHFWTDHGWGEFSLHYIRDKEKREVDFVVTRDHVPWFLVEVKHSGSAKLSKHLAYFQQQTGAKHAFQIAFDLPPVQRDCFSVTSPMIVPAQTLLSQLV
jgi:predicted AAA+ superfamily ATPase